MRIAYILPEFPRLSETFILNEVCGLLDAGWEVFVYQWRPPAGGLEHEKVRANDLGRIVHSTDRTWWGGYVGRPAPAPKEK